MYRKEEGKQNIIWLCMVIFSALVRSHNIIDRFDTCLVDDSRPGQSRSTQCC